MPRKVSRPFPSSLLLTAALFYAAISAVPSWSTTPSAVQAQRDDAPVAPSALDRVLFAPVIGPAHATTLLDTDNKMLRQQGLSIQNAGELDTRALLVYGIARPEISDSTGHGGSDSEFAPCNTCTLLDIVCSPPIGIGESWRAPATPEGTLDESLGESQISLIAYSLNTRPASDYGPGWKSWLEEKGLPSDTTLADAVCSGLDEALLDARGSNPPTEGPTSAECSLQYWLHRAFVEDANLPAFAGLSMAAVRGEPIAAVASAFMPTVDDSALLSYDVPALDRYAARTLADTGFEMGASQALTRTFSAPGVHLKTVDARSSILHMQNAGSDCVTVTLEAYRTGRGLLPNPGGFGAPAPSYLLVPGGVRSVDVGELWPVQGTANIRVHATGPMAVVASQPAYHNSASHGALLESDAPSSWAIPRAYQEPQPIPFVAMMAESRDVHANQDPADGRETNVSVFNASPQRGLIHFRTEAEGKPAREARQPIEPLDHLVFQIGFGLGKVGGPGWAHLAVDPGPAYIAVESFRMSLDIPAATERWSARAWRYDPLGLTPAPKLIALPDLGGPVGATRIITAANNAPDTLEGRVAIENLRNTPARISLESSGAPCGYVGAQEYDIGPMQTLTLSIDDLPGSLWGIDSAMVRVLRGEVAALVAVERNEPSNLMQAPPDLSTAYLGQPFAEAPPPLALPEATLFVEPKLYRLPVPADIVRLPVNIIDGLETGRCLSYEAKSDKPWLSLDPIIGRIPSGAQVVIDTSKLGPESEPVGVIEVRAREGGVIGSPQKIRVLLTRGGTIFLPTLRTRDIDER